MSNRKRFAAPCKLKTMQYWLILSCLLLLSAACSENSGTRVDTLNTELDKGNIILSNAHGGEGAAWAQADCASCHPLSVIHIKVSKIKGIVENKGYKSCMGCHGDNGTGQERPCVMCHNEQDLATHPEQQGEFSHGFKSKQTGSLPDQHCLSCHKASDMNGIFSLNRDLTHYKDKLGEFSDYSSISEFCLRCHNRDHQQAGFEIHSNSFNDPLTAMRDYFLSVDKHGYKEGSGQRLYAGLRDSYTYQSTVECTDCHSMHGTTNDRLIIHKSNQGVEKLNLSIKNKPYPVRVSDGNSAELCVLCHKMKIISDDGDADTGNGLSGVHDVSSDCQQCHRHGEAVQAGF